MLKVHSEFLNVMNNRDDGYFLIIAKTLQTYNM